MDDMSHTSGGLFGASCVSVGVGLGSSVAVGLTGTVGSRCFDFADFALERC